MFQSKISCISYPCPINLVYCPIILKYTRSIKILDFHLTSADYIFLVRRANKPKASSTLITPRILLANLFLEILHFWLENLMFIFEKVARELVAHCLKNPSSSTFLIWKQNRSIYLRSAYGDDKPCHKQTLDVGSRDRP